MDIKDYLTIAQFAAETGLTEGYVRFLISKQPGYPDGQIKAECPIPGGERPRMIPRSLVREWKKAKSTGRPRRATTTK